MPCLMSVVPLADDDWILEKNRVVLNSKYNVKVSEEVIFTFFLLRRRRPERRFFKFFAIDPIQSVMTRNLENESIEVKFAYCC
mmetsp:Transcript_17731/g.21681  ORF Transcript_17731/g.21681 Transcript_17731/m.21681 type:complete len:83 (+) Transcript_17731:292-540(+)